MPDRNSSSHYPALIPAIRTIPMKRQAGKDKKKAGWKPTSQLRNRWEPCIRIDFRAQLRYTCRDSTKRLSQYPLHLEF